MEALSVVGSVPPEISRMGFRGYLERGRKSHCPWDWVFPTSPFPVSAQDNKWMCRLALRLAELKSSALRAAEKREQNWTVARCAA